MTSSHKAQVHLNWLAWLEQDPVTPRGTAAQVLVYMLFFFALSFFGHNDTFVGLVLTPTLAGAGVYLSINYRRKKRMSDPFPYGTPPLTMQFDERNPADDMKHQSVWSMTAFWAVVLNAVLVGCLTIAFALWSPIDEAHVDQADAAGWDTNLLLPHEMGLDLALRAAVFVAYLSLGFSVYVLVKHVRVAKQKSCQ